MTYCKFYIRIHLTCCSQLPEIVTKLLFFFFSSLRQDSKVAELKIGTILNSLTVTDILSFLIFQKCILWGTLNGELKGYFRALTDINITLYLQRKKNKLASTIIQLLLIVDRIIYRHGPLIKQFEIFCQEGKQCTRSYVV